MSTLTALHLCATWFMVGLIWLVQVVQYPGFHHVGPREWPAYHAAHSNKITLIVGPAMLTELVLTVLLVVAAFTPALQGPVPSTIHLGPLSVSPLVLTLAGLALLFVAWGVTFFISVPLHQRLAAGHDQVVIAKLVSTNWIRTAAWTLRGVIALALVLSSTTQTLKP